MDDKIYFIRDNEQQIPVYDFIKAMDPDAPINPTHNFELLKACRLKMYDKAEQEYIVERTINRVETGDWEKSVFYYGWLKNELQIIAQWLSDTYPNGEKKRIKTSSAIQMEIIKYERYVKTEMERIEEFVNGRSDESISKNAGIPPHLLDLNPAQCQYLYGKLTKYGHFLSEKTNQTHFNYVFGGGLYPQDFKPLRWNRSKQAIGELIILLLGVTSVPRKKKRDTGGLFLINNKPVGVLSNPKKSEPTKDYGILEEIAKSINTRSV